MRKALWAAALVVAAVAFGATLLFALSTLASRPLDGSEGNFLFDASRLRQGFSLYVDPRLGAWDYGPVPSRYYVLYAPFWAATLAAVPGSFAPAFSRALSIVAWFGFLAGVFAATPRSRRGAVLVAVAFVGGLYPLTLFAASGRPDALAVALAGLAVVRSLRSGRVGAIEGALFALAPFFKPNVLAAGLGALAADVVSRRARAWPALAGAASAGVACAGVLDLASGGAWLEHLLKSTWMPLSPTLWLEQMATRAPFFAVPLAFSAWCALRAKDRLALSALGASVAWTLWCLAKIGSASNYWMEPCAVGVAIVATSPAPPLPAALRVIAAPLALVQACWSGVAAIRSSTEAILAAPRKRAAIASARAVCGAKDGEVVMADEPGIEMMLNGRLIEQPLVLTPLVRRGVFPEAIWLEDVARPPVRCLVMQSDLLEKTASEEDPDHDLFPPALRRALRARFALETSRDGAWIYRARSPY